MKKGALIYILALTLLLAGVSTVHAGDYQYYLTGLRQSTDGTAYLDMFNPGDEEASVTVVIFYEKNETSQLSIILPPKRGARMSFKDHLDGNFGLVVDSDRQLVTQSVQYDDTYSAGSGSSAVAKPEFAWYFAEGYSSGMAKTYLNILNPGQKEADVGVVLYYDNGQKKTFNIRVPASRNLVFDLKEKTQPEKRFGIKLTSPVPIVASTTNYNKHFSAGSGGAGAASLSKAWYFPDGYASVEASDFLNLVNPSLGTAHVTVSVYYDDGTSRSFDETVEPNAKSMILLNNYVEQLRWYSVMVTSDKSLVAEKTHYDDTYSAGHGGVGATGTALNYHFPVLLSNDKTRSHLSVFNPSAKEAQLTLTFYYNDGNVRSLEVGAPSLMRTTVDLNTKAVKGKQFGLSVASSEPVVIQQVVYDEAHSAGYSTYGTTLPDVEIIETPPAANEVTGASIFNDEYVLVGEESLGIDKFGSGVSAGLGSADKITYELEGKTVMVWVFEYGSPGSAGSALESVTTGGLFKILEVKPATVGGEDMYYFASTKSKGYAWVNGEIMYLFIAEDSLDARGAAEMYLANTQVVEEDRVSLSTIFLILLGLILFVVFVRWLFRKSPLDDDEEAVWEEMIPSAKPPESKQAKKARKKEAKEKKKQEKKQAKEAKKQPEEKKEPEKKEAPKPAPKKRGRPPKPSEPVKKISIREIPREKLTAQDILDNLEEIPDYEDVFSYVNRDQEEIKQR